MTISISIRLDSLPEVHLSMVYISVDQFSNVKLRTYKSPPTVMDVISSALIEGLAILFRQNELNDLI